MTDPQLYCDDPVCPECQSVPVKIRCYVCKARGRVTNCGHFDMPRPIAMSGGVDYGRLTCEHCESQQERVYDLIQLVSSRRTSDCERSMIRQAVILALHEGLPEGNGIVPTEHEAVSYVWNNGEWRKAWHSLLRRSLNRRRA